MGTANVVIESENTMNNPLKDDHASKVAIASYPVGCGEMRYAVEEMRTVFLQNGSEDDITLYGELSDIGENSSVNLASVLLEFTLAESSKQRNKEAILNITKFGKHIGEALGHFINKTMSSFSPLERVDIGLSSILRSMNAEYGSQLSETDLTYELKKCALCTEMETSGLISDLKMPHYALNIIYQSLVHTIDLTLTIQVTKTTGDLAAIKVMTAPAQDSAALKLVQYE